MYASIQSSVRLKRFVQSLTARLNRRNIVGMPSTPNDSPSLSTVIADTVRAELARRRLKPRDLAPALDLQVRAVERRLSGEVAFELDELPLVARFFGIRLSALVSPEPALVLGGVS